MKASPFRGRWLWLGLLVVIAVPVLVRLGFWQLSRLEQRRTANALLLSRVEQPPVVLTGPVGEPNDLNLRRVVVRGVYDYDREVVLRNRSLNGVPGVHLITPLRISESDSAVLVDRGWVPVAYTTPEARTELERQPGEVEVRGIAHLPQTWSGGLSPADPTPSATQPEIEAWFRVDVSRIQEQIPYPLLPLYVEQGEPALDGSARPAMAGELPQPDVQIDVSDGPHLGYAIQFFSFATILVAGYLALLFRR